MSELSEEEIVVKAPYHGARFIIAYKGASLDGMNYPTAEAAQAELDAIRAALIQPALERARREERERCAKVAEDQFCPDPEIDDACRRIAVAIRKGHSDA